MEPERPEHDPGGTLGGLPYFHPVRHPDGWRPLDRPARLLSRMAIAFEDISALIVVANGRADASEATALMKALVVAVRNLHALMYEFHKWFMSSGPSEHAAAERSLWDAHLQLAPYPDGPLMRLRNRVAAHIDPEAEEVDLLVLYAELKALRGTLDPVLQASVAYLNFVHRLRVGRWRMDEGGSTRFAQALEPAPPHEQAALRSLADALVPYVAAVASDQGNIASGILVTHEARYFMLTVAHVLNRIEDKRTIRFLCAGRTLAGAPEGMIGYAPARGGEEYPDGIPKPDIGFVELRRSFAEALVGVQWVTADRISFDGAAHGRDVAFIGFPRDRVQSLLPVVRQVTLAPTMFSTELRGNRPLPEEERYLDERFDFLGAIPDMVDGAPAPIADDFVEELHGICGAGVFLLPVEGERDWSPDRAQLIGIQRGVLRPSRRFVFHNAVWIRAALDAYLGTRPTDWPS